MAEKLKNNEIRVLAVRQPWASLIVEGLKTIEVRTKNTNVNDRVLIYSSLGQYTKAQKCMLHNYFINLRAHNILSYMDSRFAIKALKEGQRGKILGSVEIAGSFEAIVGQHINDFETFKVDYLAPKWMFDYQKQYSFWRLRNNIAFLNPIDFTWNSTGSWSKTELPEA